MLVMVGATVAAVMVMTSAWLPTPLALAALMVVLKVPAVVGVPEIRPVPKPTLSPGGAPAKPKLVGVLVAVI